ncbi:ABC transporter [Truncatella angustata]|uniref:ABC transporter n=1 Tax=Truncatella angustata TaxID=152316 RepID=A0A9P8RIU9_9PEZI|nr:ABC transporter [Truncatella angustata]KAH6646692.1 ABC transporter [Truncatella angustata]
MGGVWTGLEVAFYLYPCGLFATLAVSQLVLYKRRNDPSSSSTPVVDEKRLEKVNRLHNILLRVVQFLLVPLLLTSVILATRSAVTQEEAYPPTNFPYTAYIAAHVGSLLYFLTGLLPDPDGPWTPTIAHGLAWVVGVLMESVIAGVFLSEQDHIGLAHDLLDTFAGLGLVRVVLLLILIAVLASRHYQLKPKRTGSSDEHQSLLENGESTSGYGSTPANGAKRPPKKPDAQSTGWLDYIAGFRVLFPYLWPKDSRLHQAVVVLCMILLLVQRVVNILVPWLMGKLVEKLGYGQMPYKWIALYLLCRGLQGGQGAIGAARAVLWIPVSQNLYRRLACAAFEHVLGLSMDFHLSKKIGEVTSALSRGSAMNTFLESFLFQVVPMILDILFAAIYFFTAYNAFYTLIVLTIMWSYVFLTIYMAKFRARQRRDMAMKSREMDAARTDAIMAYETVQHNCAVKSETERFKEQVTVYQRAERIVYWSLNAMNLTQSSIFTVGTALIVVLSAYKISTGQESIASFVTLMTYFSQLQAPLNFFGTYYTMLQNNLIEAERMLDLFKETSGIVEKPDATELRSTRGEVTFNDVHFSYQGKQPAIDGVSFTVQPGTKTAIVGESGSGKSTCLKLLFRFYDVASGSVTVDGHDIRDLKLDSFRKSIGVVPQDTVLFNATIMFNLLYANPSASEEDVFAAARAANIHDRILAFPDQYDTKVGERGLKLSGGERQRIAIARAILKNAPILLLDEATASLDTHTERQIQDALERVTQGRTTITIAHRLSTITNSDQIVVLSKGRVVEKGTHAGLLEKKGSYYAMWEKQTTAELKAKKEAEAKVEDLNEE